MKIWLDDVRPCPDGWTPAKTAEEAIEYLKSGATEISFDHDLGTESTGYDVAKWIEEAAFHGKHPRIRWAIHSANSVGRANIERAMQSAERFWDETGRQSDAGTN